MVFIKTNRETAKYIVTDERRRRKNTRAQSYQTRITHSTFAGKHGARERGTLID